MADKIRDSNKKKERLSAEKRDGKKKESADSARRRQRSRAPKFLDTMKNHVQGGSLNSVMEEFQHISRQENTFRNFLREKNVLKNRYPDVLLFDHSRVILEDKLGGDYIHASYGQFSVFFRTFPYNK